MAPTPSSSSKSNQILFKTPQSKHRLNFTSARNTTPNPNSTAKESAPQDHPIEVVGRIRNFPNPNPKEKPISVLQVNPDKQTLRVRADFGYRDFSLDGVSLSEEEDRSKCTICTKGNILLFYEGAIPSTSKIN